MTAWVRITGGYGKGAARIWDLGPHGYGLEHRGEPVGSADTLAEAQTKLDAHMRATDWNEVGA